jgi:hypothetical protein
MAQNTLPVIVPTVDTGTQLSGWLNDWATAINSGHSGTARPSYAQPGLIWYRTSDTTFRAWNGANEYALVGADSNGDIAGYRNIGITGTLTATGSVTADSGYFFGDTSKAYIYAEAPGGGAGDEVVVIRAGYTGNYNYFGFFGNGNFNIGVQGNITTSGTTRISLASNGDTGFNSPGTGYYSFDTNNTQIALDFKYSSGTSGFNFISNASETRFTNPQAKSFNWYIDNAQKMFLDSNACLTVGNGGVGGAGVFRVNSASALLNPYATTEITTTYGNILFGGSISTYRIYDTTGSTASYQIRSDGNAVAPTGWIPASDSRLKTDVATITGALAKVTALTGKSYERNGMAKVGLIAQDVQAVVPEAVVEIGEVEGVVGALGVDYMGLVGLLVEAIKELTDRVEALEA